MIRALLSVLVSVLLAACGATPTDSSAPPSPPPKAADAGNVTFDGLQAHRALDFSCTQDSDCAVKDIGNCCGQYPACVNADSPTDPAAVARECADQGLAGICGFPVINACACVQGHCQAADSGPLENLQ